MSEETFTSVCRPRAVHQYVECLPPADGNDHAKHRKLTGLSHYSCNCGYSSGWVPSDTLPLPTEFLKNHGSWGL